MKKNLFKMMNIIRCVSGARLNPFRYTAMVAVLLMLGVGNAWAGSASTQARAYLKDGSPSGSGKVYIAANCAAAPSDNQYMDCTADGITQDGTSGKSKTSTFYFYDKAKTGYKFTGWYKKNTNDSLVKHVVDDWYEKNLRIYSRFFEDTIFCNDRSIKTLNGWKKHIQNT